MTPEDVMNVAVLNLMVNALNAHQVTILQRPFVRQRYKKYFNDFIKAGMLFDRNILTHPDLEGQMVEAMEDDSADVLDIVTAYTCCPNRHELRDLVIDFYNKSVKQEEESKEG
jgi:hypothetical protein